MNQVAIADTFDKTQVELIKNMYFKGATDEEFGLFLHVCKKTGLDPALKQVYPVKRWDSKLKRETMTVQTGIDGYRLIAERTGRYAPGREPTYQYTKEGNILSSTAYVKKQTADGTWHEVAATAFYSEYVQKDKEGNPTRFWMQMGHNQLAKCAEALCLRKAFPADLSGLYTQEEMAQADISVEPIKKEGPKLISAEQVEELASLLAECDPAYQKQVLDRLKKGNIDTLDQIPTVLFENIKGHSIKKRDEYLQKQIPKAAGE